MGAIDVLNEISELLMGNGLVIVLQNIPPRTTSEGAEIVCCVQVLGDEHQREEEGQQTASPTKVDCPRSA